MARNDIVVIGTSTGGIEALRTILAGLPEGFPGSVFVVMHTGPDSPGVLAGILDVAGPLPARFPADGEKIEKGTVYVAPPDHHLVLEPGVVRVTRGPKENRFRPAVDPLFRSAAQVYGPRVVGVILTGGLDDGTSGLWTIKQLGGMAIVQDPREATATSMPLSALRHVRVDHQLELEQIAPTLVVLATNVVERPAETTLREAEQLDMEVDIAKASQTKHILRIADSSIYACPECHGVLLELREESRMRFRCHTGHAYSVESFLSELDQTIDDSLWSTIRALDERTMLLRHLAAHMHEVDGGAVEAELLARAEATEQRSQLVRRAALGPVEPDEVRAEG